MWIWRKDAYLQKVFKFDFKWHEHIFEVGYHFTTIKSLPNKNQIPLVIGHIYDKTQMYSISYRRKCVVKSYCIPFIKIPIALNGIIYNFSHFQKNWFNHHLRYSVPSWLRLSTKVLYVFFLRKIFSHCKNLPNRNKNIMQSLTNQK